jgi:hypothetical protein
VFLVEISVFSTVPFQCYCSILFVQQIVANRDTIAIFSGNFLPSSLTLSGKAEGHNIYILGQYALSTCFLYY